ncbi:MAG: starch synthase, partial [Gemmatimonadetes bacterium]|nr:starch synthase [Gemmatimonadota bacterium]
LVDSVTHASPSALETGVATGVMFDHFDAPTLSWALDFARDLYARPDQLAGVIRAGMAPDFSWHRSGLEYERLYRQAIDDLNGAS